MKNVEERVRKKSRLKENEYEWRFLDLKRYFILTSLLKNSLLKKTIHKKHVVKTKKDCYNCNRSNH